MIKLKTERLSLFFNFRYAYHLIYFIFCLIYQSQVGIKNGEKTIVFMYSESVKI